MYRKYQSIAVIEWNGLKTDRVRAEVIEQTGINDSRVRVAKVFVDRTQCVAGSDKKPLGVDGKNDTGITERLHRADGCALIR